LDRDRNSRGWDPLVGVQPLAGAIGDRGPRLLRAGDRRSTVISTLSTVVFVGVLVAIVFLAPGGPEGVRHQFFSGTNMWRSFLGNKRKGLPGIDTAILLNIKMFLVAEVLILILALVIALVRQSSGPVMFPLRLVATLYVDVFRGVPLLLVIYMIGFGVPALSMHFLSTQTPPVYGTAALVLSYSAYVSEVYRAGLNSVHRSQTMAARSLGLSSWNSMRYVILPQAVRNVIPPLLNDFISLQKDTALVGVIGAIEASQAAVIYADSQFNYSSYVVAAILFLILTIPLARFTDHIIRKDRDRRLAGALA
jgi:polar amino acid transport system permease protein